MSKDRSQIISYKFDAHAFPSDIYSKAVRLIEKIKSKGHVAFFVGGCVRDVLMGIVPSEIDITTSASPEEIKQIFSKVYSVGEKFGVSIVNMDGLDFHVATFRKDSSYEDGRHPSYVTFSNPKEDALRRDFTVNAIFWEPTDSKLYDYVGGLQDIHDGILRAVGDPIERFKEDRLRIIRCARFVSQLSFSIDEQTYRAMLSIEDPLKGVSIERFRDEFQKILISKKPSFAIELLYDLGVLTQMLPELCKLKGVPQPKDYHPEGDVWDHTMIALDIAARKIPDRDIGLMWSILLHDIAKPSTITMPKDDADRIRFNGHDVSGESLSWEILTRLKLPRDLIAEVAYIIKDHMRIGKAREMRPGRLKLIMSHPSFSNELALNFIDSLASHKDISNWEFLKKEYEDFQKQKELPKRIVNGEFLIAMGLNPSPIFSDIIEKSYEAQLEGSFSDLEGAKNFVNTLIKTN
jgi:tRNA nucleotidyltransferase/poly(A) polymerase